MKGGSDISICLARKGHVIIYIPFVWDSIHCESKMEKKTKFTSREKLMTEFQFYS